MSLTKEDIVNLLKTNDKALIRALIVLNDRQTSTEQINHATLSRNGQGFRPCHARMGTSMAQWYTRNGFLTARQMNYWRSLNKNGKMRIEIYAGQLLEVAKEKAAQKQEA